MTALAKQFGHYFLRSYFLCCLCSRRVAGDPLRTALTDSSIYGTRTPIKTMLRSKHIPTVININTKNTRLRTTLQHHISAPRKSLAKCIHYQAVYRSYCWLTLAVREEHFRLLCLLHLPLIKKYQIQNRDCSTNPLPHLHHRSQR